MAQPIRIGTPVDVLDAVPALLGLYPTESIVGLFFEQTPTGLALYLTARMNTPTTPAETGYAMADLTQAMNRTAQAILVIYTADQDEARALMRTIFGHVDTTKIIGTVLATVSGWTTVDPDQPDVIQWTNPYPADTGTVAGDLAAAGLYPVGTRQDLADSIGAPDPATAADYALGRSLDPVPDHPSEDQLRELTEDVRHWISQYLRRPTTLIPEEAAYIARRVRHTEARDVLLELLDASTAKSMAAMWQAVAGLTPDEDALPVLACLALSAWVGAEGTLANVAIDRADRLGAGPGRSLLELVRKLIERMVPPTAWADFKPTL